MILTLPLSVTAQSNVGLVPLDQFLKKNKADDPVANIYVLDRCVALFVMFAAEAKEIRDADAERFTSLARRAYIELTIHQADLLLKTFKDPDKAAKDHSELRKRLITFYQSKVSDLADLGRSVEDDELIGGDLNHCANYLQKLRNK